MLFLSDVPNNLKQFIAEDKGGTSGSSSSATGKDVFTNGKPESLGR